VGGETGPNPAIPPRLRFCLREGERLNIRSLGISPLTWIALSLLLIAIPAEEAGQTGFKILILGDSLTEGLGVDTEEAFPAKLDAKLKKWRPGLHVINGGSSGSTSASGLKRLKWYEKAKPDLVLLALGSNDGLRGVRVEETRKNVEAALLYCRDKHWQVVLAGLKVPPNYGPEYASAFAKIYPDLAAKYKVPIVAFLLDGVAGEPDLNQADGIHPNERGHERIAENLFRFFRILLQNPPLPK
jgi:acyl-CoA thioesterase I